MVLIMNKSKDIFQLLFFVISILIFDLMHSQEKKTLIESGLDSSFKKNVKSQLVLAKQIKLMEQDKESYKTFIKDNAYSQEKDMPAMAAE